MDRESYEDEAVAAVLNEHFIAIKVDRDERPDVDARYQTAVQALIGQGGWPLTVFLLPDGRPFYGGTYFPPEDRGGRPSLLRVLTAMRQAYRDQHEEVLTNAGVLTEALRPRAPDATLAPADHVEAIEALVARALEVEDAQRGGFGRAPKFPHPALHDLLLARGARGDKAAQGVATRALKAMRAGGVYDQLEGGFHRYSVDEKWLVPHFEKMLYDNAGLLRNYVRAWRQTHDAGFEATAREVATWILTTLRNTDGTFGGSQDADVGLDDDGDHFTWTLDEVQDAVADERLARIAAARFGVGEEGHMHHDPRRCVLHVAEDVEAIAARHENAGPHVAADLMVAIQRMREARRARPTPAVDRLAYTNWNAMAIQALFEFGGVFRDAEVDRHAAAALDVFVDRAFDPDRGFARAPGSDVYGMLDDNAQMLDALLEAHAATGTMRHHRVARLVGDLLLEHFGHDDGGFADRAPALAPQDAAAPLAVGQRPLQDAPTASATGVAVRALLRLADATGDGRYRSAATEALAAVGAEAPRMGVFGGSIGLALEAARDPPPRILVVDDAPDRVAHWRATARAHAAPGHTFVTAAELAERADGSWPMRAEDAAGRGAIVCLGDRCLAPAADADALRARLEESTAAGRSR